MLKNLYYADLNGYYQQTVKLDIPNNYKIPINATLEKPNDVSPGFINKLTSDKKWEVIKNPNSIEVFNTETQEKVITEKSNLPLPNYTDIKPNSPEEVFYQNNWKLESEIKKELYDILYYNINREVNLLITSGFSSNVLGDTYVYDSSLTDQFEIDKLERLGQDFYIKCTDSSGVKKRVLHTSEQIKQLSTDFFNFVVNIKIKGDGLKQDLTANYLTMSITQLESYDIKQNLTLE